MKQRILAILLIFSILAVDATAASYKRKKKKKGFYNGQMTAHAGIGFPSLINTQKKDLSLYGEVKRSAMPPLGFRFESAVSNNVSFGGFLGYSKEKITVTDVTNPKNINGFDYSFTVVGARLGIHFPIKNKKLDPYGSAMLGYTMTKGKPFGENNYFDEPKGTFAYGIHMGANYYINPGFALFAEAGYGFAIVNTGITIRF